MTEAWDTSSIPGGEALLGTPVLCELGQCLLQITPFFKKSLMHEMIFIILFYFLPHHAACGILDSRPPDQGSNPGPGGESTES